MRGINGGESRVAGPRRGRWSKQEQQRLRELYGRREEAAIARELNRPVNSVRKMAQKLFPSRTKAGPWTHGDVERLKVHLGVAELDTIARILQRSVEEVQAKIVDLGRFKEDGEWTREDLADFKRYYGTRTDGDLSLIFGRSLRSIEQLAAELALSKDKAFLRRINGDSSTQMPRWQNEELALLEHEYPVEANLDIARRLKRSVKSVVSKAHNLGLRKSPARLQEMGRENVRLRYQV